MTGYDDYRDDDADDDIEPLKLPEGFDTLKAEWDTWPVRKLREDISSGAIDLQPDFQREYVWNSERASRYIESILLGFPTPPVFLAEEPDGRWVVIDGHQRLETLFRYMKPLLGSDLPESIKMLEPLRLNHLEVLHNLNSTLVNKLDISRREELWKTDLQVVLLPKEVDPDMKYSLFARLNLGSMSLNPQELRNCIYRGRYNNFLKRRSESLEFLQLWNPSRPEPDKRMKHRERLLRFYAMLHRRSHYRTPFRVFLNDEMEAHRDFSIEEQMKFGEEFDTAIKWTRRVFGKEAFFRFEMGNSGNPQGKWVRNRKDVLADVEMVWFAEVGKKLDAIWDTISDLDGEFLVKSLRRISINVMLQPGFQEALSTDKTRAASLNKRFDAWYRAMNAIVRFTDREIETTKEIYKRIAVSNMCALCPNKVDMEDAMWTSTREIAHRYCQRYRRQPIN